MEIRKLMEEMSKVDASTGITLSVHTSLCCPCINEFGTEEQKQKYLRPLVDGSKIGCFGLTEPGAGTDAAGVKTTADKTEDGKYYVQTGYGYEMEAIAACTIGGVSVTGGRGKVSSAIIGVAVFELLKVALQYLGMNANAQYIAIGVVIFVAISLDIRKYIARK